MPEDFDPYHIWLGIPPEEQPANYYRLLGIRQFESNLDVIGGAADRQMAHLRTFQQGKNARLSQRLLNEVSAARVCLLNLATKAAYDAQIRAAVGPATQLSPTGSGILETAPAGGGSPLPRAVLANLPVASSLGSPATPAPAQPGTNWDALIGDSDRLPAKKLSLQSKSRIARRSSNYRLVYLLTATGLLLAGAAAVVVYITGMQGGPDERPADGPRSGDTPSDKNVADAGSQRKALAVVAPHDAILTIDWPPAEREGGRLTVDGKVQPLDAIHLEFPLKAGRHRIQITREGFEPINQAVAVGSVLLKPIAPAWVPQKAVASTEESTPTSVKPEPADAGDNARATPTAKQKLPVPSTAEQERVGKQLDQTYKVEHVAEKDHALAVELFDVADGPGNSPEERYTLLVKGAGLAASAGDFELAFRRGIDPLSADYEIDPFEMKQKMLDDSAKSAANPEKIVAIVVTTEQLIDAALADERYDTALELVAMAKKVLSSAHAEPRFRKEATDRLAGRLRDIPALQKASAVAIEAETTLEKSPDDATANLTVGRWYCLYKRDWDRGLPLLAKGPDGPLKKLAEQELAVDLHLQPQLDLADGWWDFGQKESGLPRDSARLHAGEIYRLQLPNLQPGLKKTAIEKRLAEVRPIVGEPIRFPRGKWVDVLKLIDITKHAVKGSWSRNGSDVSCEPGDCSRIEVPVVVDGSYDLEVEFTRTEGDADVNTIFTVAGQQCGVLLSMDHGGLSGLDRVDGRRPWDNGNPTTVRPGALFNGRRYRLLVNVRLPRSDHASVDVSIDGKPYLPHWEGNPASLSLEDGWHLPDIRELGLATWNTRVTVHSMRLRLVAGRAIAESARSETKSELTSPSGSSAKKAD